MRLVIDDGYTLPFTTQEQIADPITGRVKDKDAQQYWSRSYEKGWEMKLA